MVVDEDLLPGIKWLELAMVPVERLEQADVTIHPIEGMPRPCFGVSIGGGWLRGNNGDLALFQTFAAASRLLDLLNIRRHWSGDCQRVDSRKTPVRCYRLHGDALALCKACNATSRKSRAACASAVPTLPQTPQSNP